MFVEPAFDIRATFPRKPELLEMRVNERF